MNLHLPFQQSPYGFLYILAISLFLSGLLLVFFKRKGWF
jgi:Mg2+ and Co2+ transporter CorA